ncbi:haloacid dehalogenase type II [Streptomyces hainanensis]|uniref:Haloacid dehalogenase type II n=1 Tax=Streptomyces hainanensis TaxID=402648 RepID=A0A4R4T111_9ACTN|nr:haloacid dehalogenase type II [Streptomyces hainanensis]TDC68542.1 haloacid dehalogenase type II [Streptomyces hainanensis]
MIEFRPKFITFDCYGTLTHFQMSAVTRGLYADRVAAERMEDFLDDFEAYRIDEVLGAYQPYPDVVTHALKRATALWNLPYRESDGQAVVDAVPTWGAHPDVPEALARLAEAFPLVILSNAADDQIVHNVAKLGAPFHSVFTAQQARAYKPRLAAFEYMLGQLGCAPGDLLHVSSSLRYDLIPAHDLRITNKVYLNRGYEPSTPYYGYTEISALTELPALLGL